MALNIFTLTGTILVDNQAANNSLDETSARSETLAGRLGEGIGKVKGWALGIGVAVAGVAAVGKQLYDVAEKSAEAMDRIDKESQQLGFSKKAFQEWDYILGQNGVSIDTFNTAMKSMTASMASLAEGGAKGTETLGKLGVTIADLKNLKQEEIFEKAVIALQGLPEGYEKARLAQELFGKQGQEMLPMLNQSKGSIEELKNKAHELGLVMSDESVNAGVVFGDTMDDLKKSFGAIFTTIGVQVLPIFQAFAEWIIANLPAIQKVFSVAFGVIATVIKYAGVVIDAFLYTFGLLFGYLARLGETVAGAFGKVKTVFDDAKKKFFDFFDSIGEKMSDAGKKMIDKVKEGMKNAWEDLKKWFKEKVEDLLSVVGIDIKLTDETNKNKNDKTSKKTNFKAAGSYKTGLERVPYDDYPAYLHKDEMVLTAEQARDYKASASATNIYNNFEIKVDRIEKYDDLLRIKEEARRMSRMGVI